MMKCVPPCVLAILLLSAGLCAPRLRAEDNNASGSITAEQLEFFEARIRPVLVEHCYECHSARNNTPKGGLRLDLRDAVIKGGDSGTALVPGKPDESLLLKALRYESYEMPPKGKLPDSVVADFERWIQMGAPDPRTESAGSARAAIDYHKALEFWAFKPPVRSPIPTVQNSSWGHGDIDRFVLSELEKRNLKPSPPADRRTLIRRVYFDLLGLPPEPEAVDAFVNDTSPDAWNKVVEQLLASPHYGERWGRYWLDLARYAEDQAHTFQARMYPQGYLYRDWVVQSLNDDMPYDTFLKLQIAGDQMAVDEPHRHRAALGLFALGPVYYQDNGEQEKAQADEWDDRIDTLMRGTQAMTVSCARCHDHKYDPFTMADYYGLAGVFASSEYRELPAVSEEVVAERGRADRAFQEKQLEIDTLLATKAPAARLKLTNEIPAYVTATWRILSSKENDRRKQIEITAKELKLNDELLRRWVAWLSEEPGSGAVSADRSYLNPWREFRKAPPEDPEQQKQKLAEITDQLQRRAESLITNREALRQRFGDNYAFVAAEDRTTVEPGVIPLGNLFDDRKGSLLKSALSTDPFLAKATGGSLGVDRVLHGWGGTAEIAAGVRFDFRSIGSDSRKHGEITNDGWSSEGGIQTLGQRCRGGIGRTEQGIGMHANALITFDLNEIRRAGLIPASETMVLKVDRAGINDDSLGSNASVHLAVIVSKPQSKPSEFDSIISATLNGVESPLEENDAVYSFAGSMPTPVQSDGKFVRFEVKIPPDARSLTLVATGAQISDTDNTISSDHAVFSNVRLTYTVPEAEQIIAEASTAVAEIPESERLQLQHDATLLSELFDDRGVLGLAAEHVAPYLDGDSEKLLSELKTQHQQLQKTAESIRIPVAHALAEGASRDVKIYMAGDPRKKGEVARRSFPAILTSGERRPFDASGSGRLNLANSVASRDNPVTARVIANRIWAGHFGYGLVRTLSNFGQLGERPSHPELLDYLALSLMDNNWSLKSLHRLILLSATWQQSSVGDPANLETDPDNKYLWKMNRRRLEVEPWRDAVLAVSNQLDRQVGGPSSQLGDDHRRRTLYGYVSRHQLNDLLRLFDFPDPNITSGERAVTTVPLQQLFVLNSGFMIRQSKSLAARLNEEADSDEKKVDRIFHLLYGRQPTNEERAAALTFLKETQMAPEDNLSPLEQFCLAMLGTNEFAYVD